jgi:hypothetical protein
MEDTEQITLVEVVDEPYCPVVVDYPIHTSQVIRGLDRKMDIEITANAAVMNPSKLERDKAKGVVRVSQEPGQPTQFYGKSKAPEKVGKGVRTFNPGSIGQLLFEYDPDKDPERFITSYRLNNTAFLKDQEVEGAKLSDWCYFDAQAKQLHRSCLWGLRNVLGLPHPVAFKLANKAVTIMKKDILLTRGVDLNAPIPEESRLNDAEVMRHQAMKEFHQSHTKYW